MKNKRKLIRIQDAVIGIFILISIFILFGSTGVYADSSVVDEVTVTVPVSCSITSTINTAHTATVEVGTYEDEIGETTFKVLCNDANGFAVYAIGYGDDSYGNTTMVPSSVAAANAIATGTATSGGTSNWAMKLTAVSGDYSPTLATGFNAYHAVPAEYTKVASLGSSTDATVGSSFKSTYAAYVSQSQAADTYTGKVKYTVVHPVNTVAPEVPSTMQNLSSSSCTTTPSKVIDTRDNHEYIIQRLLDGNCWMMENLDLGRIDLATDLTSSNTNLSTTITAATFNSWKKTSGTDTYDDGEFIPLTTSNTSNGLDTDPVSGTPYGTLYNYYATSAGTISDDDNTSNAKYDICPAGWRLPTSGTYGEFQALYDEYNSYALMRAPITENGTAFTIAGYFVDVPTGQGSNSGVYWSSTKASTETAMYSMQITTSNVYTSAPLNRRDGRSIRCVLKEPKTISRLKYLQDFKDLSADDKTSVLNSMADSTTYNLIDNRDNKTYKVAKMKDGRIWMAENLDLGRTPLTTGLNYTNTNVFASITASTFNSWKKTSGTNTNTTGEFIPVTGTDSVSGTSYGTSYNYYAASAGTISGNSNSSDASYDICPAGWRLPTGGSSGEFQTLYSYYHSNELMRNSISSGGAAFAIAGGFNDDEPSGQGTFGIYWASTRQSETSMHNLWLNPTNVVADNGYPRDIGGPIRCIAK